MEMKRLIHIFDTTVKTLVTDEVLEAIYIPEHTIHLTLDRHCIR